LHVTHRELAREGHEAAFLAERRPQQPKNTSELRDATGTAAPVQAQEA
jgi:hypothetical protein